MRESPHHIIVQLRNNRFVIATPPSDVYKQAAGLPPEPGIPPQSWQVISRLLDWDTAQKELQEHELERANLERVLDEKLDEDQESR